MDVDSEMVVALRRQNHQLRDKLRQATAVLSEVAGKGAATVNSGLFLGDVGIARHAIDVQRELQTTREGRIVSDPELSARASGLLAARVENRRGRLQEEAEEAERRR